MDDQALVFDISSDEEFGFDSNPPADLDGLDWISKILYDDVIDQKIVDNAKIIDDNDDDDVIVVGEVIVKPKRAKRSFSMVSKDDDDDCVVLECDPDKTSSSTSNDEVKNCDDDDSDDLVVVGEKGQVACRDFPHSRHLCANFPFNSTPHDSRCVQCHCYVCDSLAPCAYWGSGASTTDHCHATDKVTYWQTERKKFRDLKNPQLPVSKPIASMLQIPQSMQAPPQRRLHPIVSRSAVSPSFGVPNIVSQSRIHRPSVSVARNRYHPQMISRQLLRACNSDNQGNRVAQLASRMPPPMFKRPRLPNRSTYCSPSNVSVAFSQPVQPAVNPIKNSSVVVQGSSPGLVLNPSSRQSNSSMLPSHMPGYVFPRPHIPTSHFQGDIDVHYTNSTMHQGQSICSPLIPCNTTSTTSVRASQNNQQHTVETQNGYVPNFVTPTNSEMPTDFTQSSYQAPGLMQSCSINPYSTLNVSLLQNSLVEVKAAGTGTDSSVPSAVDSNPAFDFDVDSWLENSPDGSFFDMSSQSSQTAPIDTGMLYFDFETSWQGLAHS